MIRRIKHLIGIGILLFSTQLLFGQETSVDVADTMRESGKIYVVVAVLVIIFLGLMVYLVSIDRKISKLEKGKSE